MLDKILGLIAEGISKHAGTGNVSVPNATTTTLKSLTLDEGLWLIVGHNQWTESFSNPFVLSLAGLPRGDVVNRGTGTNGGGLNVIALEKINQPTTIKLNAYQPSGSAKTSNQIRLDAVKICLGGGIVKVGISMLSAFGRRWKHARQNFKSHSGEAVTAWHRILRQCGREHYIHECEHTGSWCEHYASGRNLYHQSTSWISDSLGEQKHKHSTWPDGCRMGLSESRFCRWLMGRIGSNAYKNPNCTDYCLLLGFELKNRKCSTNKNRGYSSKVNSDWGCASC